MIRVTVLYPNEAGKKFDVDYYKNTHMKLVGDRLKSFGFVRAEVDKGLSSGAPGSAAPFVCIGHVYLNSLAEFQKGMGQHGAEIMADIPNYTNIQPTMQISEIV
ncbi:MAG: EthD family reductase [Candidatus Rokubacteria bacterium]|nr:EthD family reductase [Candidatus Rokubacteria bacterium]